MRLSARQIKGITTLLLSATTGAAMIFAGVSASMAFQNPINLDKALREKPAQDRAQSYYHYALSKWYDDSGDMANALSEMQEAIQYNENEPSLPVAAADILARMGRVGEAMDEAQKAAARIDPKDAESHWLLANVYLRSTEATRSRQAAQDTLKQAVRELEIVKTAAPDDQRSYFALGSCYLELGEEDKAIAALERWETLEPDSDQGFVDLAQYFERKGDSARAIGFLEKAVADVPDSGQSLSMLATLYDKAKREKDAIPLYRKIMKLSGGDPEVKKQLAADLVNTGEFSEAGGILDELAKDDPQDTSIKILVGRVQAGNHQITEAVQTLKSAVASDPEDIEAQFYLGAAYEEASLSTEAVKIFQSLLDLAENGSGELKANKPVFEQHLAASYEDMGEYAKAISIYEQMVKDDPSPHTYFFLINAYRVDRQLDKALSIGKQQFDKNPKDDELALVYAHSLADAGKAKDGVEILDKRLQGDPSNLDLYINLSQIYVQAKRFNDAEKILRRAEEQNLDKMRLRFQLATVYDRQKDFGKAESLFKEILKENPKDAPTLNYIGYMLADRGVRLDEALQYVQQALALDPNNPAYLDSLGWAFFKMNELQKAEKFLLQASDMEKKDPVILDHVGDLYFKTGNLEKAQEFWNKSLSNGGEPEDAQKVREKLEKVKETIRKQKRIE
jgi:tetratricopeptide (TPR) repeat protein